MKFAFVSQNLPPSWSGQSVVIYRILNGLNPEDYCLIGQDESAKNDQSNSLGKLSGKHYYFSQWLQIKRFWRFSLVRWINIILRTLQIARVIKRENCDAVVAGSGGFFDMPAAYFASRLTGVEFYPYMFDFYSYQSAGFSSWKSARRLEAIMLKGAAGVIVPNKFLGDDLRQLYGVESTVVHNPCDISQYEALPYKESINTNREIAIVFTGSVYVAHHDALKNLLAAINSIDRWNVKLHLYTNESPEELRKYGIHGPIVVHEPQPAAAVPEIQRRADLLFLPLAFTSPYPELIRTSAPSKTGEYLAARRPVLVHAPPDSFVAWYFRHYDCGLVVDEKDPAKLAQAIERVLTDHSLRRRLSANAWARAESDFSISSSQSAFAKLMKLNISKVKHEHSTHHAETEESLSA